jgi:hypothetical protein
MLCHYAECRSLFIVMLNVVMLSVITLSVVVPSYRLSMIFFGGGISYLNNCKILARDFGNENYVTINLSIMSLYGHSLGA